MTKNNNLPSYNPSSLDGMYGALNQIIEDYLKSNLFTASLVKVSSVGISMVDVLPVIQQKTTNGEIIQITPDDTITNVAVLFPKCGQCEITYNINVGDYGLLVNTKDNCNNFLKTLQNSASNNNKQFDIINGLFIPLQMSNITSNIVVKNQSSIIEVAPNNINMTGNTDINGNVNINGNAIISGNLTVGGSITGGAIHALNGRTGNLVDGLGVVVAIATDGIITG